MPTISIPTGTTIQPLQPFIRSVLEQALEVLWGPHQDFTGIISIGSGDNLYLLFLFQGRPYAAGKASGDKPAALTIREFFSDLGRLADTAATISIHAVDPVLLKGLLIFIQGDPTAKAPANLINLEAILDQIRRDAADALIILEKRQMFNLFYFRRGNQGMSYFSDPDFHNGTGLPFDEQMLLYAFQPEAGVNALIYRDVATREAVDALLVSREEMVMLLGGKSGTEGPPAEKTPVADVVAEEGDLVLEILNGPQKGQRLNGPIPCVLGRKNADIILADSMVSSRHAAVQVVNGALMLVDLNSTTGTTLNGTHIRQHLIAEGDIIGLGATAIKVVRLTPP